MDYEKTGRLIKKVRTARNYTQEQLSKDIGVTPQAVSLWEQGKRFPDASSLIKLYEVLDLNPVELLTGLEMFDKDLKKKIAGHMDRGDKAVFVSGFVKDEDGNEFFLDLSDHEIVLGDGNGNPSDTWIPYTEYYNVKPTSKIIMSDSLPVSDYDPEKIYINHSHYIFVIPVEILEAMGKPLFFTILDNRKEGWVGFQFSDVMEANSFDIPKKVYTGKWKGIQVLGSEFGKSLCKEMGIIRTQELIAIEPDFMMQHRAIILFLDRAKRVNTRIPSADYLLPQWQYDELGKDDAEE